ncbi:hypothetical protein TanjilG_02181 [Lupinus angustifolius]|uniref:Uncharacterized protein n=1 Tax=Lupinus angustifolius TaxID=3871 RepID=A0A1J7HGM6_LUPAN|nr:hypothetical protein TanjilG_02181 [Lupinus angustifolius]
MQYIFLNPDHEVLLEVFDLLVTLTLSFTSKIEFNLSNQTFNSECRLQLVC